MDLPQMVGLAGGVIAGVAYLPQITHLINEKCTAGISLRAFTLWTVASFCVLISALLLGQMVFIFLSGIQLLASAIIVIFTDKYKGNYCPSHLPVKD